MEKIGSMWASSEKKMMTTVLCGLLLSNLLLADAFADKVLQSPNEPIEIKLNQTLSTRHSHPGDPFQGTLTETYRLGERELPAGTLVKGQVQDGHVSMILGMPGYVALDIQEAALPSGAVYHFEKDGESLKTKKYHNPNARTGKGFLGALIPFSAVSALVVVPLNVAAGMSYGEIVPISLGARMALGIGMETSKKYRLLKGRNYPVQNRIGFGMLRGTGLVGAYEMMTTGPEPDLKEGAVIAVHLPKKHMQKLFEAGDSIKTVEATPVTSESMKPVEVEAQSFETVPGSLPLSTISTQAMPKSATIEDPVIESQQ